MGVRRCRNGHFFSDKYKECLRCKDDVFTLVRLVRNYDRPSLWYCMNCGYHISGVRINYCPTCKNVRPFISQDMTQMECENCCAANPISARFCEWCGIQLRNDNIDKRS